MQELNNMCQHIVNMLATDDVKFWKIRHLATAATSNLFF